LINNLINHPSCFDHILIKQPSSLGTDNLPCALSDCDEPGQPDFNPFEMFVNVHIMKHDFVHIVQLESL